MLQVIENGLSDEKGKFYPFKADVTKEDDILNAFQWTETNLGPIHVVINNAGIVKFKKLEGKCVLYFKTQIHKLLN